MNVLMKISHRDFIRAHEAGKGQRPTIDHVASVISWFGAGEAYENLSIVKGRFEPGIAILLFDTTPNRAARVFMQLQFELKLGCAWVRATDEHGLDYKGCILKWPAGLANSFALSEYALKHKGDAS